MNEMGMGGIPFLFVLDFDLQRPVVIPLSEVKKDCIRYDINPDSKPSGHPGKIIDHPFIKSPIDFETYHLGFEKVMNAIHLGDTYLLNLCYATRLTGLPSLEFIFENVAAPYKLLLQNNLVVFSPERFVLIEDGSIKTYPMKGTIDASIENAKEVLMNDVKEVEEHATVVDLLRNDLSIVAKEVTVDRYRYITEVRTAGKTLLQCSSEITGRLDEGYQEKLGTIIHALLPAGSVTGAPKKRTVELIREIELEPRGYYTGVFGIFDGSKLDSAVMIRMIEQRSDGFFYRSGGGITYQSEARQEYQEMIDKVYLPGNSSPK